MKYPSELEAALRQLLDQASIARTCLDCEHFTEGPDTCGLVHPPARPPARIIVLGCPKYVAAIPF